MANYVKSIVFFKGKKDALNKVVEYLKQGGRTVLDFNLISPVPEDLTTVDSCSEETGIALAEYLLDGTYNCLGLSTLMFGTVRAEMESDLGQFYDDDRKLVKEYMIYKLKNPYLGDDYWERCMKWYKNLKKYGYTDWFTWKCEKWGTKSNACETSSLDSLVPFPLDKKEKNPDCIMTYQFETAWSMPDGIYKALSAMFPDVSIEVKYADEDLGRNCGHVTYKAGEKIESVLYDGNSKESYEFATSVWDEEYLLDYLKQDKEGHWYLDMDAFYEKRK